MKTLIGPPKWFKYKLSDFIDKNEEVWNYIRNIKEFSKIVDLYIFYIGEKAIEQSLKDIIEENFKNYDCDEIKNYFEKSNRFKLNSFNTNIKDFLNYCEKRNKLAEIIDQDLNNLKKLKKCLEDVKKISKEIGCEKYFGVKTEIEDIKEAEKISSDWSNEKQIIGDGSDDTIIRLMKLFPKTFEYVNKNKLGWNLGGWSGGF